MNRIDYSTIHITDDLTAQDLLDAIVSMTDDLSDKNDELKTAISDRIKAQSIYDSALQVAITSLREQKYPLSLLMLKAKSKVTIEYEALALAKANAESIKSDMSLIKTTIDSYRSLLSWLKVELSNS